MSFVGVYDLPLPAVVSAGSEVPFTLSMSAAAEN